MIDVMAGLRDWLTGIGLDAGTNRAMKIILVFPDHMTRERAVMALEREAAVQARDMADRHNDVVQVRLVGFELALTVRPAARAAQGFTLDAPPGLRPRVRADNPRSPF